MVPIFSISETSICLNEPSKFADERYFQIIFLVLSLGSKLKLGFVWWAKKKSNIDFSDTESSIFFVYFSK